jgi:hypothetical protein
MTARTFSFLALALAVATLQAGCAWRSARPGSGERPGLGTAWGETRESRVRTVHFERGDQDRPVGVATLRYDDADGIRAMLPDRDLGWTSTADGVATVGSALHVRLLDTDGAPLPHLRRDGRHYVVGRSGDRYAIEIENRSAGRFEAVATVDGLDVFDGRRGSFAKRGYLVGPWSTLRIDGFRRSMDEVAAFRFGSVQDSYAVQKGDDANVGVIAVAFFGERDWPLPSWRDIEADRRHRADPFPGRFAEPPPGRRSNDD